MYIDPITRQTFNYATPLSFDNNPENVIAVYFDNDLHFVLTPEPVIRPTPVFFQPDNFNRQSAELLSLHKKMEFNPSWI